MADTLPQQVETAFLDILQDYPEISQSLSSYTKYYDNTINRSLRRGIVSVKIDGMIKDIYKVLDLIPASPAMTLYRGITPWSGLSLDRGQSLGDLGFSSKTLSLEQAFQFITKNPCCLYEITYQGVNKQLPCI